MKTIKTIFFVTIFFVNYQISAQNYPDSIIEKNSLQIPFSDNENNNSLLVVINSKNHYIDWFIFSKHGVEKIINSPSSFLQIADISLSPNQKYLSVISVGEGHPLLEVFLFSEIININVKENNKNIETVFSLNPYPGYVSLLKWSDNEEIIVDTDRLLTNNDETMRFPIGFENNQQYSINLKTSKISPISPNAKNPIKYFQEQLKNKDKYLKENAQNALKILNKIY